MTTKSSLDFDSRALGIHIVGIGGAGMRAIARVLAAMGHKVTGTDANPSRHLDELAAQGIEVAVGHASQLVVAADLVTRSSAVPDDDADIVSARASGIPVLSRADVLAKITQTKSSILIAGTHGKTTTASMLAVICDRAGLAPGFVIGSDVARFGTGARWGDGDVAVIEADESDGSFLALHGSHAIVTSLDPDHLEHYGSRDALDDAFRRFVDGIAGTTVVCLDDPDVGPLLDADDLVTYGTHAQADLRIGDYRVERDRTIASLVWQGVPLGEVTVGLAGLHNLLNAAGASAMALTLGIAPNVIADALREFGGVARRFERRGTAQGITLIDDYAHLPAEVEAAIATAKAGRWKRIVATYQPHRYSRTEALGHTFAHSFEGVDQLVLTDIYPSGETPRPGITGRIVLDAVCGACPDLDVVWRPTLDSVTEHLADELDDGDLCLTLGAGDLTTVPDRVLQALGSRAGRRSVADRLDEVARRVESIERGRSLGQLTTYRVGGPAEGFTEADDVERLVAVTYAARECGVPILLVGRGSNLLIADRGFDGLAISLTGVFGDVSIDGTRVRAGAAVPLPTLARQTVKGGLTGFEWAVGVPGALGGAVVMNAGGHGAELGETLVEATVLDTRTGLIERWEPPRLGHGYRRSAIGRFHVVLDATIELMPGQTAAGESRLAEIVKWRRENQPGGQNAGSVFTNPPGDSAGRLIDEAGGKGRRRGSAEVSTKHGNFIQVDAGGSADDVFALMREVAALVDDHHGVTLEPETRLVGFEPFRRPNATSASAASTGLGST